MIQHTWNIFFFKKNTSPVWVAGNKNFLELSEEKVDKEDPIATL